MVGTGNDSGARSEGEAFRKRLLADLRRAVEAAHAALPGRMVARGQVLGTPGTPGAPQADPEHSWVLAGLAALHRHAGDRSVLEAARDDMLTLCRASVGADGAARPFLTSLRHLQPFCQAYETLRGQLADEDRRLVEGQIAASACSKYDYLDWGPHNRAVVDGASLLWAARVVPEHAETARWRRYGEALLADSWGRWSIEDASIYTPLWMVYLLSAADVLGRADALFDLVPTRYYFEYWRALLTPEGWLPDFGDADWTLSWEWYVAALVRAGSHYQDGRYLWMARRLYERHAVYQGITTPEGSKEGQPLEPYHLYCAALALDWLDVGLPFMPFALTESGEALDDLIGKKVVFRSGPDGGSAYALLNYRDEGQYAKPARDYLNQQLGAYEEKPHHGHADEQSIVLLMVDGTVLLHDGGYRLGITPEAYRADLYHNRVVGRTGFPVEGDLLDYVAQNKMYAHVQTEKLHFETFGVLDYSRTRLVDPEVGYTADRVVLFAPRDEYAVVVDSIHVDRDGHKTFLNVWHPGNVLRQGADYVASWPECVPIRLERWANPHTRELLIRFLETRDAPPQVKVMRRAFRDSAAYYQPLWGHFFAGQRLTFVTLLAAARSETGGEAERERVQVLNDLAAGGGRTLGLRMTLDGCPATVGLKLDRTIGLANVRGRPMFDVDAGTVRYGALETDADLGFVVERGGEVEYGFVRGARVRYGGETLFETPVGGKFFQWFIKGGVAAPRDTLPRYHERRQATSPA